MKRTQTGWAFIIALPLIQIFLTITFLVQYDVPFHALPPEIMRGWYISLGVITLLLLLFYQLTIEVTDEAVKFKMGIGIIRGEFLFEHITHVDAVSYIPMGWGIRLRTGRIIYNVAGRKAIELTLNNRNNNILLGNDHPDEIANYIKSKHQLRK